MTKTDDTIVKIIDFLQKLLQYNGTTINMTALINEHKPPYSNQILSALVNTNTITWERRGWYKINKFYPSIEKAEEIRQYCAADNTRTTRLRYRKSNLDNVQAANNTVLTTISTAPFGFDSFTEIMVEQGSITIGEYTLTGNFTIKRTTDTIPVKKK